MALQKTITIKGIGFLIDGDTEIKLGDKELIINDAYVKIEQIAGSKESLTATLSISNRDKTIVFNKYYVFNPLLESNENFISQFYNHLKTLEEFKDAEDC